MGSEEFSPFLRFFSFFFAFWFFFAFLRFSSLFFVFLRFSLILLEDKGKRLQFTAKMGNFTPTPSAPTPFRTSRPIWMEKSMGYNPVNPNHLDSGGARLPP